MREASQVWSRANALLAMYVRSRVEGGVRFANGASRPKWRALGKRLTRWSVDAEGLEAGERLRLAKGLGSWGEQVTNDASWCLESAGFLLWTVRMQRLRAWDRAYVPDLLPLVDAPSWVNDDGPRTKGRPSPRLRKSEELEEMLDRAELWHWRAVNAQSPPSARRTSLVRETAAAAEKRGFFRAKDGDFPYRGRPYRVLADDAASTAHSIAVERHRAIAWVLGKGSWKGTRTDT